MYKKILYLPVVIITNTIFTIGLSTLIPIQVLFPLSLIFYIVNGYVLGHHLLEEEQ